MGFLFILFTTILCRENVEISLHSFGNEGQECSAQSHVFSLFYPTDNCMQVCESLNLHLFYEPIMENPGWFKLQYTNGNEVVIQYFSDNDCEIAKSGEKLFFTVGDCLEVDVGIKERQNHYNVAYHYTVGVTEEKHKEVREKSANILHIKMAWGEKNLTMDVERVAPYVATCDIDFDVMEEYYQYRGSFTQLKVCANTRTSEYWMKIYADDNSIIADYYLTRARCESGEDSGIVYSMYKRAPNGNCDPFIDFSFITIFWADEQILIKNTLEEYPPFYEEKTIRSNFNSTDELRVQQYKYDDKCNGVASVHLTKLLNTCQYEYNFGKYVHYKTYFRKIDGTKRGESVYFLYNDFDCQDVSTVIHINEGFYDCYSFSQDTVYTRNGEETIKYYAIGTNDVKKSEVSEMANKKIVALFLPHGCEDVTSEFVKEKKLWNIQENFYIYEIDYCINPDRTSVPLSGKFVNGVKGYCDKGKLFIKNYTTYNHCEGNYVIEEYPYLCVDSYLLLCLDYHCNDVGSYNMSVCSGHGECIGWDNCTCQAKYWGDYCEKNSCFGFHDDDKGVCKARGKCIGVDNCHCSSPLYSGLDCSVSQVAPVMLYVLGSGCVALTIFSILIVGIIALVIRIKKYTKLKNFDTLLEEQRLLDDHTIANFQINKSSFVIEYSDIKIIEKIGKGGGTAHIYKVEYNNTVCAFKVYETSTLDTELQFEEFEKEVKILASVSFKFILQFFGASIQPPPQEYCEPGDLKNFLLQFRKQNKIEYPEKARFLYQISTAMDYLHRKGIVHRDLKTENVLVDKSEDVKVMDFGLSKIILSKDDEMTVRVGTGEFMAPEVINVFSFGILIFVVIEEEWRPYGRKSFNIEMKTSQDPNFRPVYNSEKYDEWLKDIMVSSWNHDPSKRSNFIEICETFKQNLNGM